MTRISGGALPTKGRDPVQRPSSRTDAARHRGAILEKMIADLNPFARGWPSQLGFSQRRD
jgi:hypothetical protein